MATEKRTAVLLSEKLLRKARKTLNASSNTEAVTKALQETLANREIQASLKDLIRKGRGRFVDVYDWDQTSPVCAQYDSEPAGPLQHSRDWSAPHSTTCVPRVS